MDHDETRQLEELRRAIRVGIDQADEGRLSPLNEEMVERIKAVGRKRLAAERLSRPKAQDRFASKSLQFAYDRYIGADPSRALSFEEELANERLSAVLSRGLEGGEVPLEEARFILDLGLRDEDKKRMLDLLTKQQEGKITTQEAEELEAYIRADNVLSILKAKARLTLKTAEQGP